jgi:hypothetical protein
MYVYKNILYIYIINPNTYIIAPHPLTMVVESFIDYAAKLFMNLTNNESDMGNAIGGVGGQATVPISAPNFPTRKIEMKIHEKSNKQFSETNTNPNTNVSTMAANTIIAPIAPIAIATPALPKTECIVCCEKYNRSTHIPIACQACGFEACRQCHSTFILDPANQIPNCMECHKEMPREFLVENFTQKFVTQDWKKHRETVMFQKEKALLPTRQRVAELVRRKDVLRDEEAVLAAKIAELEAQRRTIATEKQRIDHRIRVGPAADAEGGAAAGGAQRAAFVRPCPNTEANCRGFLSTQWKCNLCNMWACKDCHEIKGAEQDTEHTCHPDNLASAKLIDAETRGCPKCGARVFKISGCNQMFCTACNDCAFDWVTGRIETVIHNPHYYEFQRQRNAGQAPRVAGDILCGREIDHNTARIVLAHFPMEVISSSIPVWRNANREFYNFVPNQQPKTKKEKWDTFIEDCVTNKKGILLGVDRVVMDGQRQKIRKMLTISRDILFRKLQFQAVCRIIIDMRLVMVPRFAIDPLRHNEELGVNYLLGKMTEKEFATALQRSDKNVQKSRDIQNVLTMVINTATDIIFRFAEHLRAMNFANARVDHLAKENFEILEEIRELFRYANGCFARISKNYNSKSVLAIGQELEDKYWEDDGSVIYEQMDNMRLYHDNQNQQQWHRANIAQVTAVERV